MNRLRAGTAVAVLVVLLLAVVGAAVGGRWQINGGSWMAPDDQTSRLLPTPPPTLGLPPLLPAQSAHPIVALLLWLIPALAVLGGALYITWRTTLLLTTRFRRTGRDREPAAPGTMQGQSAAAELALGLEQARSALEQEGEPRDAIVACWLALERAAARTGAEREPSQTATEFTVTVLSRTPADGAAVQDLCRLFLQARFSEHPIGPPEMSRARRCVEGLNRTWPGWSDPVRRSR